MLIMKYLHCKYMKMARTTSLALPLAMVSVALYPTVAHAQDTSSLALSCEGGTLNQVEAVGQQSEAFACGVGNRVKNSFGTSGQNNVAYGIDNVVVSSSYSLAIGNENEAFGTRVNLVGSQNQNFNQSNVNIFGNANSTFSFSTVLVGNSNSISYDSPYSVAIGEIVKVGDDRPAPYAVAIGHNTIVASSDGIAIGAFARAGGDGNNVAIGARTRADTVHTGALSINGGTIAGANPVGVVSFGSDRDDGIRSISQRQIQNVGAGVVSATSTDAVNGSQLYAVGTQVNQNTVGLAVLALDMFDLRELVGQNSARIDEVRNQAFAGVAASMAMTDAPMPSAPGKTSYAAKGAVFRGETAFGASISHRLNTVAPLALTAGISHAGGRNTGATVGVAGEF